MNKKDRTEHAWGRKGRDDVPYTDDAIATLQADIDPREKADALRVPDWDVAYHVAEVAGWSHHGAVIRKPAALLREWYGDPLDMRVQVVAAKPAEWPTDRAWWSARTIAEVVAALGKPEALVRTHVRNAGLQLKIVRREEHDFSQRVAVEFDYRETKREFNPYPESKTPKPPKPTAEERAAAQMARRAAVLAEARKQDRTPGRTGGRPKLTPIERARRDEQEKERRRQRAALARVERVQRHASKLAERRATLAAMSPEERAAEIARTRSGQRKMKREQARLDRVAALKPGDRIPSTLRLTLDELRAILPSDPKWWESRTNQQAAAELGIGADRIKEFRAVTGFTRARLARDYAAPDTHVTRTGTGWPADPAWWLARTVRQASIDLDKRKATVYDYVRRMHIETKEGRRDPSTYKGGTHKRNGGRRSATPYPKDPAWWTARTIAEAATELGVTRDAVRSYARYNGYTFKPDPDRGREFPNRKEFPLDPAWWAARTIKQLSRDTGMSEGYLRKFMSEHGLSFRRPISVRAGFPMDPAWWAQRTIREASQELGVINATARAFAKRHGFEFLAGVIGVPIGYERVEYPHDPQWWAERTYAQITAALGIARSAAHEIAKRHGYTPRTVNQWSPIPYPTDPEWWAARTVHEAMAELGRKQQSIYQYTNVKGFKLKPSPRGGVKIKRETTA